MRPRSKGLSIRYYISALLILVSAAGLALAWDIYQESARISVQPPAKAPEAETNVDMSQLEALFQEQPTDPGRYQVIAEQNLFSENRRAAADQAARQAARNAPERRDEVQLLGTSIMGESKSAMLRFLRFSDKKKAHVVELGQTVRDEREGGEGGDGGSSYTLEAVEQRRVTLKDQSGQSFSVTMDEPQQGPEMEEGGPEDLAGAQAGASRRMQDTSQGGRGTPDPAARVETPAQEPRTPPRPTAKQNSQAPSPSAGGADNTTSGTWNLIR